MKPSATHKWLCAWVMAIVWAMVTAILWAVLAVAFGRSKSDGRLISVLIIGTVIVALIGAHAYSEGWKSGSRAKLSPPKDSNL
jgi:hypothetical protein